MGEGVRWRRLPVGAEVGPDGGVHFRVWAPDRRRVEVVVDGAAHPLAPEGAGYFAGIVAGARAGSRYRYRLDGGDAYPDPASRFQPEGPHGPSEVIDPTTYRWRDAAWRGVRLSDAVMCEIHVGTFTPEGTYRAAATQLRALRDDGINVVELMPLADFAGSFGWGYDGVDMYAPTRLYGRPDDLRAFVDEAHALGIGVIHDVVYNHVGPAGMYLTQFARAYLSERHKSEWGETLNYDGDDCAPVREFFIGSAAYWISEFHFDGLRLDATQQIFDDSQPHVVAEIGRAVREAAGARDVIVVAENEQQDARIFRRVAEGGWDLDGAWNDDFHHSARVSLTGRREAYYSDYLGRAQEFVSAAKHGFLFQGQRYEWQRKRRGSSMLDVPPTRFVHYLENHDQVSNSLRGERMRLASPGRYRALTALLCLGPQAPMLFQGQERGATAPFAYFADHEPELGAKVARGRQEFIAQFPSVKREGVDHIPDPRARETFERCVLRPDDRDERLHLLFRDLLRLRREGAYIHGTFDGAVLASQAFCLRRYGDEHLLLVVNLGAQLSVIPAPEPLLAPPTDAGWIVRWSSEDPRYGGWGTPEPDEEGRGWCLPGDCAILLSPAR